MIQIVSSDRCIQCKLCVKVCPTNVFDADENGTPIIARQEDCQTCFICEAYCPADALYVSPMADRLEELEESRLIEDGLLGSWRAKIGWSKGSDSTMASRDTTPFLNRIRNTGA